MKPKNRDYHGWSGCNVICLAFVYIHISGTKDSVHCCISSISDRLGFNSEISISIGTVYSLHGYAMFYESTADKQQNIWLILACGWQKDEVVKQTVSRDFFFYFTTWSNSTGKADLHICMCQKLLIVSNYMILVLRFGDYFQIYLTLNWTVGERAEVNWALSWTAGQ